MNYAFISYSSAQPWQLNLVKKYLKTNSISFWSAPDDIPIGAKYSEVIKHAIENSSCVLFLLSDRSQNSTYCKLEIALALKMEKPIIPIQVEDVILNDEFSLYLSNSEIFPLPRRIRTAKTNKLLNQLRLLCAASNDSPVQTVDPSYKVGCFKMGTWLQIFGWIWMIGGIIPIYAFAASCFVMPNTYYIDSWNSPVVARVTVQRSILISILLLIGLFAVCYGFSLNRKIRKTERLFFNQFSVTQLLLLLSYLCFNLGCWYWFEAVNTELQEYEQPWIFWEQFFDVLLLAGHILYIVTFLVWLVRTIYRLRGPSKGKGIGK